MSWALRKASIAGTSPRAAANRSTSAMSSPLVHVYRFAIFQTRIAGHTPDRIVHIGGPHPLDILCGSPHQRRISRGQPFGTVQYIRFLHGSSEDEFDLIPGDILPQANPLKCRLSTTSLLDIISQCIPGRAPPVTVDVW